MRRENPLIFTTDWLEQSNGKNVLYIAVKKELLNT